LQPHPRLLDLALQPHPVLKIESDEFNIIINIKNIIIFIKNIIIIINILINKFEKQP